MDNAAVATAAPMLVPAQPGVVERLAALPARSKMSLGAGIAAVVAVLVALSMNLREGEYRVLFTGLNEKDGGQVIEKLQQLGVPYRIGDGANMIMVPANKVYELRMKLGAAGLPKGGETGYDALDKVSPFGRTQRLESMSLQRAREGELVRTITTLDSVAAARVHLAMPNQNGFFREQEKASASVVLTLHPGRTLDRAQIAGIVHLVSRSVPDLKPSEVSVIDSTGALLNPQENASGLDSVQLDYRRNIEQTAVQRVLELLEPVVGRGNLRATVTADVDFSQVESTAEEYRPNSGSAPATIRATRSQESSEPGSTTPSGVPGAQSNQPQATPAAPITGPAAPLQAAQAGATGGSGRREAETRYEVDKTVRVTRGATGTVRRLHAAVVVNHRTVTDPKGKTSTVPLSPDEIEKLTALVQQGIGFDAERGDKVQVVNAPFHTETPAPEAELPLWEQPWAQDLLRSGATPAALVLVALIALFGFVRPALKAVAPPPPAPAPGAQLDAVVADEETLPVVEPEVPQLEAPVTNDKLEAARRLAKENPAAVANIMRSWVSPEASA
ncbi:MAG: flagellar M-ring protein FliF [Burkholderiaceae bacterium]|nr:flagellar M-ring protein FliF [Rhodoferax sp.]MCP5285300.1 flagellar M-ring protein FliF [Burkholderiaceae bacterium]